MYYIDKKKTLNRNVTKTTSGNCRKLPTGVCKTEMQAQFSAIAKKL